MWGGEPCYLLLFNDLSKGVAQKAFLFSYSANGL